jgi:choline dehydrogenase-like flavoprotein
MTKFERTDTDVVVVVGSGAGGGTAANELTAKGVKVVLLEAGQPLAKEDFVNWERASFEQLSWTDTRTSSGTFGLARSHPGNVAWMARGLGGTTNIWTGVALRMQQHELHAKSVYGDVAGADLADWPVTFDDLAPYFDAAEERMGVSGVGGRPRLPANNNYKVIANGARRAGFEQIDTGPLAVNSVPFDGRPATIQDGFATQGDKGGARWSTLVAEIPQALASGLLEIRTDSQATRLIEADDGRITHVEYIDSEGNLDRQAARLVVVAAGAVETPRLLLMSESRRSPDGVGNSNGLVGRFYMRHVTGSVFGVFEKEVRMYRGESMAGIVADNATHEPDRGFVGGYHLEQICKTPGAYAVNGDPLLWGDELARRMANYIKTSVLWICGEDLPRRDNRVSLNWASSDRHGLPVPHIHYDDGENEVAMREHAYAAGRRIYEAVGAEEVIVAPPYPSGHNLGTCRMGVDDEVGVVDKWGRVFGNSNLLISDTSIFTTSGCANPTLTLVGLVTRQIEWAVEQMRSGLLTAGA